MASAHAGDAEVQPPDAGRGAPGRRPQPSSMSYQHYQSGPVSCTLIFLTTLLNEMCMTQLVRAKSLAEYAKGAVGHSQGLASAACLSFVRNSLKAVWALFRQGLIEQQVSGLRHLSLGPDRQVRQSSMVTLRGRPHAYLQYNTMRSTATASIINSESSVVCSGKPAMLLLKKLESAKRPPGVQARPLPIPFASHSVELTPALYGLLDELRCRGHPGKKTKAKLRVYPFTPGLNLKRRRPLDLWRTVVARQMTTLMDFPAMVEQAATELRATHVLDFGPTDSSVAARLLAESGCCLPVVSAVAGPRPLAAPAAAAGAEPAAPLPARVLALAAEVLGLPGLAPEAPLREAGASSQNLGALRSRLQELLPECAGRLPAARFFGAPTVAAIVQLVAEGAEAAGAAQDAEARPAPARAPPIAHVSVYQNKSTTYPLSFGQEQMLRVQTVSPGCTAYNCSASVWIAGGASPARVRACLQAVLARHEVFSGLAVHSPPGLRLLAASPRVGLVQVPDEAAALARLGEVGRLPFRLAEEASVRCEVLSCPSGLVLVLLWVHHMSFDILSQGVLHGELRALLASREASLAEATARLPELPVQYADYSIWSRNCVAQGLFSAEPVLAELAPHVSRGLDLPLDRPRPRQWTFQGDRVVTRLPQGARPAQGATPFVAYLAAFFVQLWKSSGQEAVVVGVPYHGRDLACLQPLCGYFINMLPVVGRASAQTTVAAALAQTQERWQQAMDRASVPFLHVVDSLNKQHMQPDPSRNSVFQAMLNYRAETLKPLNDPRFRVQQVHQLEGHMDLDVQIDAAESGVVITHNYCTSLFEPRTAERFAAQYMAALRAISLEEWKHIQTWRIPSAPRLLEDIQEAKAISLEYSAQKLTPLLAEMHQPVLVGGPTGLQVLP